MESKMEEDQLRDILDQVVLKAERSHPLTRHLRTDHLMVMEGDAATFDQFSSAGFADIVQ
jgi:hypothetical protein